MIYDGPTVVLKCTNKKLSVIKEHLSENDHSIRKQAIVDSSGNKPFRLVKAWHEETKDGPRIATAMPKKMESQVTIESADRSPSHDYYLNTHHQTGSIQK